MSELQIVEINLIQHEQIKKVGPVDEQHRYSMPDPSADPGRDAEIEKRLEEAAASSGLTFERKRARSFHRPASPHRGGFASVYTTIETISLAGPYLAYAGGAAAGVAIFVRNVLGSVTEWQKLRDWRSVEIVVKGKKVQVKDGADAEQVLKDIQASINSLGAS
jgi:hypothetical protein